MFKEQIEWVIRIEEMASSVYEKAARYFASEKDVFDFIQRLESDEKLHEEMLRAALRTVSDKPEPEMAVYLAPEDRTAIEERFSAASAGIESGRMTKREFIEFVVEAEYSEWNDLFLYVIAALKAKKEFRLSAVSIQKHKRIIEDFVKKQGWTDGLCDKIKKLQPVWEERVLAVDDEENIRDVIKAVLASEARVDTAGNGAEALEKLKSNYYAVIISDVEMPVMDGLSFYREAEQKYPNLKKRFVFFSGSIRPELASVIRGDGGVRFLKKPFSIKEIRSVIVEILSAA